MNAYFLSQFGYYHLVWMNHCRILNNCINELHERALRLLYSDFNSTFPTLLIKGKYVRIHQRNLQTLKISKAKNNLVHEIMKNIFSRRFSQNIDL